MPFGGIKILASGLVLIVASCSQREARPQEPHEPQEPAPQEPRAAQTGFAADLKLASDGTWNLTYQFAGEHAALLFDSVGANRTTRWKARDDGQTIENLDGLDVLLSDKPAAGAHFTIEPTKKPSDGTAPFLHFSDGSVAVHLGQFSLLTVASRAEAAALGGSLRNWRGVQPVVDVTLRAEQPLLGPDGRAARNELRLPVRGGGGYVYVGNIKPAETKDFVAVIDPGLPNWLAGRIHLDLKNLFGAHRKRWGEGAERSIVLLAFGGGGRGFQNNGFASGRQLSMSIRGDAYKTRNADALGELLWFFAHEAAHQFQFRGGIKREPGSDWISEGAANAMATAILVDMGVLDRPQLERSYWSTHRRCVAELRDGPLQGRRGQAGYVCGDLIAQMTAASLADGDLFSFWNSLRESAKRSADGSITAAGYFALLRQRGLSSELIDTMKRLVEKRLDNGAVVLADGMRLAGLAPTFSDDGGLSSMKFPVAFPRGKAP